MRLEEMVEEAILLAYRFPDLSNEEVLEHAASTGPHTSLPPNPESYYGQIVLMAYESKSVKATNRFIQAIGPDAPLELEQPEDPA